MKHTIICLLCFMLLSCDEIIMTDATVAFYNVENLFDTVDDPKTYDEQYTPDGDRKWDDAKYKTKLSNLAKVISQIANNSAPTFLGICEIENKKVIEDLIDEQLLKSENYGIVHYDSPDERGIDVAFIYKKGLFTVIASEVYQPDLSQYNDKTRDILYVKGKTANGETLHFMINHWPSRGGGRKESEPKRIIAAQTLLKIKNQVLSKEPNAKIIVMGDFNDEPSNKSIKETFSAKCSIDNIPTGNLYNPFCELENQDLGSYRYRKWWDMLDQIMISKSLISDTSGIHFAPKTAAIKAEQWMIQTGKYEGFPLRTFGGKNYLGGYSDHFPVFLSLSITASKP